MPIFHNRMVQHWRNIRHFKVMSKPSIIIIGAGVTGLIAAKELSASHSVIILEAQPVMGGRIKSLSFGGHIIESGAEFIHGNLPTTMGLLKDAGIEPVKIEGQLYRKKNGRLQPVEEMTEGWDGLLEKMKNLEEDTTMQQLLDQYYDAPRYEQLRWHVKDYVEGFDLADLSRVSVKALYQEWSAEEAELYRIPNGYGALVKYLQNEIQKAGCEIHLEEPVKEVQWRKGMVTVHTSGDRSYTADKLLVTVPVSVLQQPHSDGYFDFNPPIHFDRNNLKDIGFGAVIKVAIKFKIPFWEDDASMILSDELFPTWWTQLPDKTPLLTGWLGGPGAASISNETDEVILNKALSSVAGIFDRTVAQLKDELEWARVFNWQKNEYALGGYSYSTVNSDAAKALISIPLEHTIYFAGEALYTGPRPGTVEASLESGIQIAGTIRDNG